MSDTAHHAATQSAAHFSQRAPSPAAAAPTAAASPPAAPSPPPALTLTWRERVGATTAELLGDRARVAARAAAALVLAAVAIVAVALWFRAPVPPTELRLPMAGVPVSGPASADGGAVPAPSVPVEVVVHAAGAVVTPGVYRLAPGARVSDVLDAAGGPAADADLDRLNLAMRVEDGARVYVPRVGEAAPGEGLAGAETGPDRDRPLNLNTATAEQLDALPGVGPTTAEAILEHRRTQGRFRRVDDLLDVPGIGEAKLARLRPLVTV